MDIFGIGPLELALILLLALIILGPKDLQKTGKMIGRGLNKIVHSDTWKTLTQTSKELRHLPNKLMREANLDELKDKLDPLQPGSRPRTDGKQSFPEWSAPVRPTKPDGMDALSQENTIATPDDKKSAE